MKKTFTIIILLIIVAGLAYALKMHNMAGNVAVNDANSAASSTADREVKGTVQSVNTDQVAVDGPALVTIKQADGTDAVIAVPSMGINLCAASSSIADVYSLKTGDAVGARGKVGENGQIIPCESPAHYLHLSGGEGVVPASIAVTGTYLCLPHTDTTGLQTDECALGIQTDDGTYYSLSFGNSQAAFSYKTGDRLNVSGTMTPAEALNSNAWQKYPIKGIISVASTSVAH
ncbi:MAG TPA: hypothetical protein VHF05_02465 [Candidatus Paceibacterota bacterium]|nr:hypothetical protein [Candidatus Paceibacterota bacterium]